ncbi:MAG TPA: triose-phosphate isomerase [Candidatus Nanoarchaeia archaeon]|nr:triose-phosphate isomerase [Candidatus Nanoarchaeia archaeon]
MLLVVNFKTYAESTGMPAMHLADIHNNVAEDGADIIIAVQPTDIAMIALQVGIPVYAQHVDAHLKQGKNTGYILPEAVKIAGAQGTLLNHAEHRIPFDTLVSSISRCHQLGLKAIVCSDSIEEVKKLLPLKPYAIAFEDPELIGSGQSITKSKVDVLKEFVHILAGSDVLPLCGAGISTHDDMIEAKNLGTKGVLVASAITLAKDPESVVRMLLGK